MSDLADRLEQLAKAVTKQDWYEFTMRVPADPKRDADLVLSEAAARLRKLEAELNGVVSLYNASVKKNEKLETVRKAAELFVESEDKEGRFEPEYQWSLEEALAACGDEL